MPPIEGLEEMFADLLTPASKKCQKCGFELDPEDGPGPLCEACRESKGT